MYLKCPLCGKLAHLNCFTPDEYSDDIECVEMRSLGRGRGFQVTSRFSALGNEGLMDMISRRCHAILTIVGEEVTDKSAARERIEELEGDLRASKDEVDAWSAESEELVSRVNAAFNAEYDDLDDAVSFLLEVALE